MGRFREPDCTAALREPQVAPCSQREGVCPSLIFSVSPQINLWCYARVLGVFWLPCPPPRPRPGPVALGPERGKDPHPAAWGPSSPQVHHLHPQPLLAGGSLQAPKAAPSGGGGTTGPLSRLFLQSPACPQDRSGVEGGHVDPHLARRPSDPCLPARALSPGHEGNKQV